MIRPNYSFTSSNLNLWRIISYQSIYKLQYEFYLKHIFNIFVERDILELVKSCCKR